MSAIFTAPRDAIFQYGTESNTLTDVDGSPRHVPLARTGCIWEWLVCTRSSVGVDGIRLRTGLKIKRGVGCVLCDSGEV